MTTADCFATIEARFADWRYSHPLMLYALTRWLRPQVVVEVGTYRGYAACYLARALQENNSGHLYCIDPFCCPPDPRHHPEGNFVRHWDGNLRAAGVRDWVTLLEGRSEAVEWPKRVDLAFIDGDHSYACCSWDVGQAISRGATALAVDNTALTEGPARWAAEFREAAPGAGWDLIEVTHEQGFLVALKRPEKPAPLYSEEQAPFGLRG